MGLYVCRCIVYRHGMWLWVCTGAGVYGLVWEHGRGVWVYECMRVRVLGYGWEGSIGTWVSRCMGV